MPTRLCTAPRCPNPAIYRGYCHTHAEQRNRQTHNYQSVLLYKRKRWRILRRHILDQQPICQHCDRTLATEVDHIQPIEHGGQPYDPANLQALCTPCHSAKTQAELHATMA